MIKKSINVKTVSLTISILVLFGTSMALAKKGFHREKKDPWEQYYTPFRQEIQETHEYLRQRTPMFTGNLLLSNQFNSPNTGATKLVNDIRTVEDLIQTTRTVLVPKTYIEYGSGVLMSEIKTTTDFQTTGWIDHAHQPNCGRGKSVWLAKDRIGYAKSWQWHRAEYLQLQDSTLNTTDAMNTALGDWNSCVGGNRRCSDGSLLITGTNNVSDPVNIPTTTTVTNTNTTAAVPTTLETETTSTVNGDTTTVNRRTFGDEDGNSTLLTSVGTENTTSDAERLESTTRNGLDGKVFLVEKTDTTTTTETQTKTDYQDETTTTIIYEEEVTEEELVEREETYQREVDDHEFKLDLSPLVFFDFQYENQIINLTPHFANNNIVDTQNNNSTPKLKYLSNKNSMFLVNKSSGWDAGLGLNMMLGYTGNGLLSQVFPALGLAIIKGSTRTSKRLLKSYEHERFVDQLDIPLSTKDLDAWRVGESLTYTARGGSMFVGTLAWQGLAKGELKSVVTKNETTITKIAENKVAVKTVYTDDDDKVKSFSSFTSLGLVSLSTSEFTDNSPDHVFFFDLSEKNALTAYREMLNGNVFAAEVQSEVNPTHVRAYSSSDNHTQGNLNTTAFGVPFIATIASANGYINGFSKTDYHYDHSKTDSYHSSYIENDISKILFEIRRNEVFGFYALAYETKHKKKKSKKNYFGKVGYSINKISMASYQLKEVLKTLIDRTGLKSELMVEIPKNYSSGFVNVNFSLKLDKLATNALMTYAAFEKSSKFLKQTAANKLNSYFKNGDQDKICKIKQLNMRPATRKKKRNSDLDIQKCKDKFAFQTKFQMLVVIDKLKRMKSAKNLKTFSILYSEFGRAMLKNRFIFQSVTDIVLAAGQSVEGAFSIRGENIANYEIKLHLAPVLKTAKK